MKNIFTKYNVWMLVVLFSFPSGLKSQPVSGGSIHENVQVCTDRQMYVTGEKILISAIISTDGIQIDDYSCVLYCELVSPAGTRITGDKIAVTDKMAQGCLEIPTGTITGVYFLKSYTRNMRNGDPGSYNYIMLKIINPDLPDVLSGYPEMEPGPGLDFQATVTGQSVNLAVSKNKYRPWEEIELNIGANPGLDGESKLCLALIPAGSLESPDAWKGSVSAKRDSIPAELQYYPETRGISLSGRFLESETGRALANSKVNLSIIGDRDVMAVRTNSSGEFYFALPGYVGSRDVFLCGEDIPGISTNLLIDNDFCPRNVNLPAPAFHLTDAERKTAYMLAVNQKLTAVFQPDTNTGDPVIMGHQIPFYGQPDETLVMDNYIDLPTLEEYFYELLGQVNIRKQDGKKHFRFLTTRAEMTIFDPLVLIDWVAVDDVDRVLAMSPRGIDRIELVNAPYIKGDITYGGIISFVSKKNDFAGIDLPASGTFINYSFYGDCGYVSNQGPLPDNIPDSRNTIYWDPDVKWISGGESTHTFKAPGMPGKYLVVLKRIAKSGVTIVATKEIEVATK